MTCSKRTNAPYILTDPAASGKRPRRSVPPTISCGRTSDLKTAGANSLSSLRYRAGDLSEEREEAKLAAMASDELPELSDEEVKAEVADRLDYSGSDTVTEQRVLSVLVHLPEGVRTFALERCRFASVSDDGQQGSVASDRVLVLVQDGLDESAIRHAVAHAWLGHDLSGHGHSVAVEEDDVRELVAQWEFAGPGADA